MAEKRNALDALDIRLEDLFSSKGFKKLFSIFVILSAVIVVAATVCTAYLNDYYHADSDAVHAYMESAPKVDHHRPCEGVYVFTPRAQSERGIIFYPGGKVEAEAYVPLMAALASKGITAVLCEMPYNLAVLDINAADEVIDLLPEVKEWYVAGHSLGGSMAASYLADNSDVIKGIVLLGSYSTSDLTGSRVLSIYGSEDGVMNREKYEKYKSNLPADFIEIIIEGGNHAYFGMYGEQDGDGKATVTPSAQIRFTADKISKFIQ